MTRENRILLIREGLRLAELLLDSQIKLMLAADQRATTFSGIMLASLALVASIYDSDTSHWNDDFGLAFLFAASALSLFSARSVKVQVPGNHFSNLLSDIDSDREISTVLKELGHICDLQSNENRVVIRRNARLFNLSLLVAFVGLTVSLAPSVVTVAERILDLLNGWEAKK